MSDPGRRSFLAGFGAMLLACGRGGAGWAATPGARGGTLRRIGALEGELGAPLQIVPRGDGALVVLRQGIAIADAAGVRPRPQGTGVDRLAIATASGWWVGTLAIDAHGEPGESLRSPGSLDVSGARQLALRVVGGDSITAVAQQPLISVLVQRHSPGEGPRWWFMHTGRAAAAVDESGAMALATDDGRVRVLGDPSARQEEPRIVVDVAIDPPGYAITFDRGGICLLAAQRDDTRREGGDRIAAPVDWQPSSGWSTEAIELARDGTLRSRAKVGFAGLQAPLRLSDGSIAVVGMGAARVADGAVKWTRPSTSRMHACAAADELVLGYGGTVELVGPGGEVRRTDALGDEKVACAPAVGAGGEVWIATTRSLWRIG